MHIFDQLQILHRLGCIPLCIFYDDIHQLSGFESTYPESVIQYDWYIPNKRIGLGLRSTMIGYLEKNAGKLNK